jgi:hypothetical protein
MELALDDLVRLGSVLDELTIVVTGPEQMSVHHRDGTAWPAQVIADESIGEADARQLVATQTRGHKVVVARRRRTDGGRGRSDPTNAPAGRSVDETVETAAQRCWEGDRSGARAVERTRGMPALSPRKRLLDRRRRPEVPYSPSMSSSARNAPTAATASLASTSGSSSVWRPDMVSA